MNHAQVLRPASYTNHTSNANYDNSIIMPVKFPFMDTAMRNGHGKGSKKVSFSVITARKSITASDPTTCMDTNNVQR